NLNTSSITGNGGAVSVQSIIAYPPNTEDQRYDVAFTGIVTTSSSGDVAKTAGTVSMSGRGVSIQQAIGQTVPALTTRGWDNPAFTEDQGRASAADITV